MRPRTIPILAAVALSLAVPSNADARLRFGPAALLGAVVGFGAMFGGYRHSARHHRRSATYASAGHRRARVARIERGTAAGAPRPAGGAPAPAVSAAPPAASAPAGSTAAAPPQQTAPVPSDQTAAAPPEQTAAAPPERALAIFWPDAARDLVDYVLLPTGNDRFWAYGYDAIVQGAFVPSDVDDRRGARNRPTANQVSDAASPGTAPFASAGRCGNVAADAGTDALIERIERAIEPTALQRDALEKLRAAVAQAIERIQATCPAAAPASLARRLTAIQDRIWAMHDALLTLRLPFEDFSNSLTEEQRRRLRGGAPNSAQSGANATDGRAQTCAEPAAGIADGIMRAIGRAAAELGRHGKACCRFLPRRSAPESHGAVRRCNGSPRRHAVRGDEHEPGAATALRFARRQAEGGSQPGAAASPAFRPRRRALVTSAGPEGRACRSARLR